MRRYADAFEFIKDHTLGCEGASVWYWWQSRVTGGWKSVGFANDTVEDSLEAMYDWLDQNGHLKEKYRDV